MAAASARNSLPRQVLLNTHQGAPWFPGQESGDEAVKLFMEENVYPRAHLASTPHIVGQAFELPVLPFPKRAVYLQGEFGLDDYCRSLPIAIFCSEQV